MNLFAYIQLFMMLHPKMGKQERNAYDRNAPIPSCKDCAFYKPFPISDPYNRRDECKKYAQRDSISGTFIYDIASLCREDVFKCGPKATHFVKSVDTP